MSSFDTFVNTQAAIRAMPGLWAYLDPGTGSMVLQVLLAGLLSTSFFLKSWVRHVRDAFWARARN